MDRALGAEPADGDSDAAYRGFLFADLRGYTEFVQRHGDAAAADLLDAYRALVRDEVARFTGAEIRTEGDSFYVVFPSARRAVACALAILAAAERDAEANPERPIRVGIGVNAGETVQRDEGFVGTAVNLAARVCSQARAGEVLVTAPVRDAIGGGGEVHVEPRGTRRLKGIEQAVPLFAVLPGPAPARPDRRIRRGPAVFALVGLSALLIGVLALAVLAGWFASPEQQSVSQSTEPPTTSPSAANPSQSAAASPAASDPSAYPNQAESALLGMLGDRREIACECADDDERPAFRIDRETALAFAVSGRPPLEVDGGISCHIRSIAAPDVVQLWATRYTLDYRASQAGAALIANEAGALGIPRGDCQDPAIDVAHGEWTVGDLGGKLLCREVFGEAVIEWTYDDEPIYAVARRRDGDHEALMDWWRDEARLLSP